MRSQDRAARGNYAYNMAEMTPLPGSARRPVALGIDWAAALAEHDRWLRTIVFARLGERQAVDEVMQEVALAAVAQQAPLNDRARITAWLYRLAVRQALLYRRRLGRQRRLLGNYAGRQAGDLGHSPSRDVLDGLLHSERKALVREALKRLPARDAEILLLKYTEDWSYRELAAKLGVSESAVQARLHRARERLRAQMIGIHVIEVTQ
jgi:RNA polymerase sigma factor (sigma-70 family)